MWAGDEIINCPDHHPDHPEMFNPEEEFVIHRIICLEPSIIGQGTKHPYLDQNTVHQNSNLLV